MRLRSFQGLVPAPQHAAAVAAVPYDVVNREVFTSAPESHPDFGCTLFGSGRPANISDIKKWSHFRRANQTYGILVQLSIALGGIGRSEAAVPVIPDRVAFHFGGVGVKEKAPMGLVPPQEIFAIRRSVLELKVG